MKYIEDKLEQLDAYFAPKKESEKWLVILGVAGIISYIAYSYLLPYTEDMYKKSERIKKSIEKNILNNQTYLTSITVGDDRDYKVKEYEKEINNTKESIVQTKKKIRFINENLSQLSDMLFNQKSWSRFLNSITNKAEIHNVDIEYIQNNYVDENNGSFGYVLEIAIGAKGEYKGIIKFMNELEQNTLVTDIYGTKFSPDANSSDILVDINISVWGINH